MLGPVRFEGLVDYLSSQIENGELTVGDRLPSFTELQAKFNTSPNTVNRALIELEHRGLIIRERRRGVFVAKPQSNEHSIGLADFSAVETCSPYHTLIRRGIESVVHAEGHGITMLHSDSLNGLEKVDGVLGHAHGAAYLDKLPLKMPRVSVMLPWEGAPAVIGDDYTGAFKATEHLLSLGHRRIGFMGFVIALLVQKRVAGYEMALRRNGLRAAPEWLWDLRHPSIEEMSGVDQMHINIEIGRINAHDWFKDAWNETGLTAVVCQNDEFAIGFMQAAREAGLRVPQDVSVVGFDSTPLCNLCSPRLTSIYYPLETIGAFAAKLLLRQIRGEAVEPYAVELPVKLDVRESTGPAPQ